MRGISFPDVLLVQSVRSFRPTFRVTAHRGGHRYSINKWQYLMGFPCPHFAIYVWTWMVLLPLSRDPKSSTQALVIYFKLQSMGIVCIYGYRRQAPK